MVLGSPCYVAVDLLDATLSLTVTVTVTLLVIVPLVTVAIVCVTAVAVLVVHVILSLTLRFVLQRWVTGMPTPLWRWLGSDS